MIDPVVASMAAVARDAGVTAWVHSTRLRGPVDSVAVREAEVAAFLSTVQRLIDNLERAEVDGHVLGPEKQVAM